MQRRRSLSDRSLSDQPCPLPLQAWQLQGGLGADGQAAAHTLAALRTTRDMARAAAEDVLRRESTLFEQLQKMQLQQRRATAAALEELPAKLQKKHKLDVKQRLQQSYRLLFEARGFSNFCQVRDLGAQFLFASISTPPAGAANSVATAS